jgi:response regulator of citrate/malate metabolism
MQRLRQFQQQYEQELITKGIMPYTTEQVIQQYAEKQRIQMTTNKIATDNFDRVRRRITFLYSNRKLAFSCPEKMFNGLYSKR